MDILSYISITLDIFGIFILLVFLLGLLTTEQRSTKMNRLFILIVVFNIFRMISDVVAWVVMGNTEPYSYTLNHIANFSFYLFQYLLLAVFIDYVVTYIGTKAKISRIIVHVVYIVCAISILLLVISQFNHMFYVIDEQNVYHRQNGFWVSQLLWILCITTNGGVIIAYRKYFSQREFLFLSVYVLLPILGSPIHYILYGLPIANAVSTIDIIIIYVSIQSEQGKQLKQQELELTNSRIDIMLSQIQPHFLYNSLVAIKQLYRQDPQKGEETLMDFTAYLRNNMDSLINRDLVTFDEELRHVKTYLSIEKERFGDKLNVEFDTKAQGFELPTLTLQPIVENAVRYGITKRTLGGTVTIRTEELENAWRITVLDDGIGFDSFETKQDGHSHIGIENVRNRLTTMCGGTLEIESAFGVGTTAYITIPKGWS